MRTHARMRGRSFLKELDYPPDDWRELLDLARDLKLERQSGMRRHRLADRNIAVVFEKASTRTRCAFEVGAHAEGAHVTYLDPSGSHLGHKESLKDSARVLGRMFDGIEYRGFAHEDVETIARYAGVPVWNGLSDTWHPTQALCDMLTMREHVHKPDHEITFAYCGDAQNNVANSLLVAGAMMGMDVRMVAPRCLLSAGWVQQVARGVAQTTGARLTFTDNIVQGVAGVDVLYTDVWVSMGEPPASWADRIALLAPYQVNDSLLDKTGNPDVKFMHCLPALHNLETDLGRKLHETSGRSALEVTDEVFESEHSIVFDQAENRLHTIRAVLVATLGG